MMKKFDEINVVPLIDVLLVLLVMVLVSASLIIQQQLNVELPVTQTGVSVPTAEQRMSIVLQADGVLRLGDEVIAKAQLAQRLSRVDPDVSIDLWIDQACAFGHVVGLLDVLQGLRLNRLAVHTQPQLH